MGRVCWLLFMKVTRLEIFGFKSFMERLVLPLEHGVTGVVGPNGCGKSNIVDAIRWVLGETRAGALRGDVLEDVIFNGTDKLRPLGLAEVSITVRASQGDFFKELCELAQVADVANEVAAPDFAVEGADARSEEGSNELGERGTSAPLLQLVPDKEASQLDPLAAEPAGSPQLREEVPGFLSRFAWLRSVQEVQVTRRLYRSGESEFFINRVPCRLRDLKEFFRVVGLGPRAYTIVAQGEVGRIVTARPEERRLILEEAAGVSGLRDRIQAARRRLEETSTNVSRINDIIAEVTRQVQTLKRQAAQARNREQLKNRIRELDTALYRSRAGELQAKHAEIAKVIVQAGAGIQNSEAELQKLAAQEDSVRAQLMALDLQGDESRRALDAAREELNTRARARAERMARERELRAFVVSNEEDLARQRERLATLKARSADSKGVLEAERSHEEKLAQDLTAVRQIGDEDLRQAGIALDAARQALRGSERVLQEARERVIRSEASLREIRNQIVSLSPAEQLRKSIIKGGIDGSGQAEGLSLFVDGLSIPKDLVRAVQTILGERAAFVVADDPFKVARTFLEAVAFQSGGSDIVGVGVIQSGSAQIESRPRYGLMPLAGLIRYESRVAVAVQEFLGHVYVAPDFEGAVSFFAAARQEISADELSRFVVVTHEGDLITARSFYSLRHEGGAVYLKSKAEELEARLSEERRTLAEAQGDKEAREQSVRSCEEAHKAALTASQERDARARRIENELTGLRAKFGAEQRLLQQLTNDAQNAESRITALQQRLEEHRAELARIAAEVLETQDAREKELQAIVQTESHVYERIEGQRRAMRGTLGEAAQQLAMLRNRLDRERQALNNLMLDGQRAEIEVQNLEQRFVEEYGAELWEQVKAATEPLMPEAELVTAQEEVQRLRARILREGDVDMSSIERCREEEERLTNLLTQRDDLSAAAKTIESTIHKLIATSKAQFLATFDKVQHNFSELIPRLFGGGKGMLVLLDPENPLESGVDIVIRPPGKKLKTIELLSGGEKAMCATALIMGMFMVKPGPLCVMDEVDAPLDEANLVRFLSIVREMSLRTQFILITHNKQSMSAADSLVGVTMQEPGASKVLSVSLQEAYSQVA